MKLSGMRATSQRSTCSLLPISLTTTPIQDSQPTEKPSTGHVEYARRTADYRPAIEDLIAEGDRVLARLTGRGRLKRNLLGFTIVDREIAQPGIVIWRVADGQIVERWARQPCPCPRHALYRPSAISGQ